MSGYFAMMNDINRTIREERVEADTEITALRELVRYFREWLAKCECECDSYNGHYCGRCSTLNRIDADLAFIGKERDNGSTTG